MGKYAALQEKIAVYGPELNYAARTWIDICTNLAPTETFPMRDADTRVPKDYCPPLSMMSQTKSGFAMTTGNKRAASNTFLFAGLLQNDPGSNWEVPKKNFGIQKRGEEREASAWALESARESPFETRQLLLQKSWEKVMQIAINKDGESADRMAHLRYASRNNAWAEARQFFDLRVETPENDPPGEEIEDAALDVLIEQAITRPSMKKEEEGGEDGN